MDVFEQLCSRWWFSLTDKCLVCLLFSWSITQLIFNLLLSSLAFSQRTASFLFTNYCVGGIVVYLFIVQVYYLRCYSNYNIRHLGCPSAALEGIVVCTEKKNLQTPVLNFNISFLCEIRALQLSAVNLPSFPFPYSIMLIKPPTSWGLHKLSLLFILPPICTHTHTHTIQGLLY